MITDASLAKQPRGAHGPKKQQLNTALVNLSISGCFWRCSCSGAERSFVFRTSAVSVYVTHFLFHNARSMSRGEFSIRALGFWLRKRLIGSQKDPPSFPSHCQTPSQTSTLEIQDPSVHTHWSAEPGWGYWSISWAEFALVIPLHAAVFRCTLSNEECNSSIQVNSSSLHRGSKSKYYDHLVKVDNTASCTITFRPLIEIWLDRGVLA